MTKFEIIDHEHDVVVVGAGGAGFMGTGGAGIQIPATFRDPAQEIGEYNPASGGSWGWFAGGGGAGSSYSGPNGPAVTGGIGGGGDGGHQDRGSRGLANTGGGGGGGGYTPNYYAGAEGASGIVLIAYPT